MEPLNKGRAGGRLLAMAGGMLALLWVASMSVVDNDACNSAPACLGLALALLLALLALLAGQRPARPTATFLLGLAVGLFFLLRCALSESVVEGWRESALLLGGFVFYGAGYVFAQRRGSGALSAVLAVAVLLNILYFFLLREPAVAQEWTGRPEVSLTGANSRGVTLFVYKNFAGIFLMVAGALLFCRPLWEGWRGRGTPVCALVGLMGMVCACFCGTRAVLLLLPLLALGTGLLGLINRLYSGRDAGWMWPLATGLMLLTLLVALGDLFLGHTLLDKVAAIDTHLRTQIWRDICRVAPDAPWYGYGASATQWMIVPIFDDWETPNFAHNEYMQAWCDYGVAGLALMLLALLAHLSSGFWKLASEELPPERRVPTTMALLLLVALACCAAVDFVWHNFAFVGMTAFACGLLAAPAPRRNEPFWHRRNWAEGSRPPLRPVRAMGRPACALACMGCLALALASAWLGWRLLPAWQAQWAFNAAVHRGAPVEELSARLVQVMPDYPDTAIADCYAGFSREAQDWAEFETLLRLGLNANPRQLFTVTMLAEVLWRQGKHEEAEALLREKYAQDGPDNTRLTSWAAYYGQHLLQWGKAKIRQGEHGAGLSMLEYAYRMERNGSCLIPDTSWRAGSKIWVNPFENPRYCLPVNSGRLDVRALRAVGVEPDDSWQQPLFPGGKPALYSRWGKPEGK